MLIDFAIILLLYYLSDTILKWSGFEIVRFQIYNFWDLDIEMKNISPETIQFFKITLGLIPSIYFSHITFFTNGQSIGKIITSIQVISIYHHRIGLWHCTERSPGYLASTLELGTGFFQTLWNPNRMALHYRNEETIVIRRQAKTVYAK